MVKGVNKTIIEINNTENEYFDRILLFVNSQYADSARLKNEVAKISQNLAGEKGVLPLRQICRRAKLKKRILTAIGVAVFAGAALALYIIFR